MTTHKPVLLREVIEIFDPKPGEIYIDATINGGGHAYAILERIGPEGKLIGVDWDCRLIDKLNIEGQRLKIANLFLSCDNYANLRTIASTNHMDSVDGILFDLGFSSYHIEASKGGFSFQGDEPLDMRYNIQHELTAEKIINTWPQQAIEDVLREYGGERNARRIASALVDARTKRRIWRTKELTSIIGTVSPRRGRLHPATKTFQALRIAVNDEIGNLNKGLLASITLLKPGGKIIIISFHSLEDRTVKHFFKNNGDNLKIMDSKPLRPDPTEIKINPHARSAKLRWAERIS